MNDHTTDHGATASDHSICHNYDPAGIPGFVEPSEDEWIQNFDSIVASCYAGMLRDLNCEYLHPEVWHLSNDKLLIHWYEDYDGP